MLDAFLLAAVLFACFLGGHVAILSLARAGRRDPTLASPPASLRYALEFIAGETLMLSLVLMTGLVRLAPFSLEKSLLVLVASVAWWEFYFYLGHRLLHTRWLFRFHRSHHEETRVHASLTFGLVETVLLSSGFYLPLAVGSHAFGAVSIPTLVIALGGAYVLNVLSHLQWDGLSTAMEGGAVRHVFNSPRYHAFHHARGAGNFGLNAPWFDRLFRTEER